MFLVNEQENANQVKGGHPDAVVIRLIVDCRNGCAATLVEVVVLADVQKHMFFCMKSDQLIAPLLGSYNFGAFLLLVSASQKLVKYVVVPFCLSLVDESRLGRKKLVSTRLTKYNNNNT